MKDLSHLVNLETGLTAGESNSAGNTVNRPNPTGIGAPGSEPVNPPPAMSELDTPGMEVPAVGGPVYKPKFGNNTTSVPATWKKAGE